MADAPYEPNLGGTWQFNLKFLRCCDQPVKFVYSKELTTGNSQGPAESADISLTASVRPSLMSMKHGDGCSLPASEEDDDDGSRRLEVAEEEVIES